VRIFKTKAFARFCRRESVDDKALTEAVSRARRGLVDADLGGDVIKQRIARRGQGRSGGYRTIILFRIRERAVFVDGFAKSDMDNISDEDLDLFRTLAAEFLSYDMSEAERLVERGAWIEVDSDA
jgi:hypothetical protein